MPLAPPGRVGRARRSRRWIEFWEVHSGNDFVQPYRRSELWGLIAGSTLEDRSFAFLGGESRGGNDVVQPYRRSELWEWPLVSAWAGKRDLH
jgi:hypothetical protein